MLAAVFGDGRQSFLLYGTELAASTQIELLQQALQNLAKTGLPGVNPGAIDGTVNDQTLIALAKAIPHIPLENWVKEKIVQLAADVFAGAVEEAVNYVDDLLNGPVADARGELVTFVTRNALPITDALNYATAQRTGQTAPPGSRAQDMLNRFSKGGTFTPPAPVYDTSPTVPVSSLTSTSTTTKKVVTYTAVGAGVLGLGFLAWKFLF